MGFSIWLADDPELEDDAPASDLPGFSLNFPTMRDFQHEMRAQGMFADRVEESGIPAGSFNFSDGILVPAERLEQALAVARDEPMTFDDLEGRELWSKWLEFLRLGTEHGGIVVY
ncbi:MAG: hypothetical protein H0U03_10375 [Actinobacteria bacterium]|nr:hypothetical protein [Actinomycetota bacterium]